MAHTHIHTHTHTHTDLALCVCSVWYTPFPHPCDTHSFFFKYLSTYACLSKPSMRFRGLHFLRFLRFLRVFSLTPVSASLDILHSMHPSFCLRCRCAFLQAEISDGPCIVKLLRIFKHNTMFSLCEFIYGSAECHAYTQCWYSFQSSVRSILCEEGVYF